MKIISPIIAVEFLALVVSLIYCKTLWHGKLRSLPFFLAFMLCVEVTGRYLHVFQHISNSWLYNISVPLEYSYYTYLFWLHGTLGLRKFLTLGFTIFLIVLCWDLMVHPFKPFHTYTLVTGQVLIIISCCLYIYGLFLKNEEYTLFRNYFYWLVCGLLLFNLGDMVYFVFDPLLQEKKWDKFNTLFTEINTNLNYLLYFSYIASIIVFKKYQTPAHAGNH
jgi:hypothetical protein